jgi:hypothetical protein
LGKSLHHKHQFLGHTLIETSLANYKTRRLEHLFQKENMLVSSLCIEDVNLSDEDLNKRAERKGAHEMRKILHYKATKRCVNSLNQKATLS